MNKIKTLLFVALAGFSTLAAAQYTQLGSNSEFMFKVEAGYSPFMGNLGKAGAHGYYLDRYENAANFNLMAGANISQDWFVGGGAGFCYYHNYTQGLSNPMMGANVFIDVDFRPIWTASMGLDYQPSTIKWAPLLGGRVGGSVLLGPDAPAGYGMTVTPMVEFYGGLNWYYMHGLRNMGHNWHSFYATLGIAYMQQTVFLPICIGWRW